MAFVEKPHHHKNAKAILGLLVVLIAFAILGIFITYQDNLVANNALQPFIVLAAIGLGLLAGLMLMPSRKLCKGTLEASRPS